MIFYLDNRQDIVNEWEHTGVLLLYIKHINIYFFISVFIIISGSLVVFVQNKFSLI